MRRKEHIRHKTLCLRSSINLDDADPPLILHFRSTHPRGLTFTWWGCYGLCQRHKPTEVTHSFLFCSCVCCCLYGPFNCIKVRKYIHSPDNSPFLHSVLPVLSLSCWSFQLYISLGKSPSALI